MLDLLIGFWVMVLLLTSIRFAGRSCPPAATVFLGCRRPLRGGPHQILIRAFKQVLIRRDGQIFGNVAGEILNLVDFAHSHRLIKIVSDPTSTLTLRDVFRHDRPVSLWISCDTLRGRSSCIEDHDRM
jgi:hypothetical protein